MRRSSTLAVSGAAARVAEGGAENVPLVRMGEREAALSQLRAAGFQLGATIVRGGEDLFATPLPERLVYVMGAEGEGMDPQLAAACDLRLSIPGSGAVESLNVAAATAVLISSIDPRASLIVTAASSSKTSFGCQADNDWTFFGDALVNHALRKPQPLAAAADEAVKTIAGWEREGKLEPSDPQVSIGAGAAAWLGVLDARAPKAAGTPVGKPANAVLKQ